MQERGFYASVELVESLIRGNNRFEGSGLSGTIGIRFKASEIGLYLRRAGTQRYGERIWHPASTSFGPIAGYTYRLGSGNLGFRLTGVAVLIRHDRTIQVNYPDRSAHYRGGAALTAHSVHGEISYFREIGSESRVKLWPMVGVYRFFREDYAEVEYYVIDGEEREHRNPAQQEGSVGLLFGMPLMVEPAKGHVFGLEPFVEVDPLLLIFGGLSMNVAVSYNF